MLSFQKMTSEQILETLIRGAAAGINFILFLNFAARAKSGWLARLGALFAFSTFVWVVYSAPVTRDVFGSLAPAGYFFSLFNSVFFWWFATALFDDQFRWRLWRLAPFAAIALMQLIRLQMPDTAAAGATFFLHQSIVVVMMGHAMFLAISEAPNDLIEERRRFRTVFAALIAATGIGIAVVETADWFAPVVEQLSWLQAAATFSLSVLFAFWLLSIRASLLAGPAPAGVLPARNEASGSSTLRAADRPVFNRLSALMEAGVYREEGLTVAKLAAKVEVPEHHLRKLINGELGFRNFSSFLNARRINDARTMLADPANARKQILQIALDLGYGSIAPFNRAFKEANGQTPTEFRKAALGAG